MKKNSWKHIKFKEFSFKKQFLCEDEIIRISPMSGKADCADQEESSVEISHSLYLRLFLN